MNLFFVVVRLAGPSGGSLLGDLVLPGAGGRLQAVPSLGTMDVMAFTTGFWGH